MDGEEIGEADREGVGGEGVTVDGRRLLSERRLPARARSGRTGGDGRGEV